MRQTVRNTRQTRRVLPTFKYTSSEKRQLFASTFYENADVLINCVRNMPWDRYKYNGKLYSVLGTIDDKGRLEGGSEIIETNVHNTTELGYYFFGGAVYELLNIRYQEPNLHHYCDPTSDVDVALVLPKVGYEEEDGEVPFILPDGNINPYCLSVIDWVFNNFYEELETSLSLITSLDSLFPNLDFFNIDEYSQIDEEYKTAALGYRYKIVGETDEDPNKNGKFILASFFDTILFKIQLICKVKKDGVEHIDHILEFVINPNDLPPNINYSEPLINIVEINREKYPIDNYVELFNGNYSGYGERRVFKDDLKYRHKAFNHTARLLYLYELFYQNPSIDMKKVYNIFLPERGTVLTLNDCLVYRPKFITDHTELIESVIPSLEGEIPLQNTFLSRNYVEEICFNTLYSAYLSVLKRSSYFRQFEARIYNLQKKGVIKGFNLLADTNTQKQDHDNFIETYISPNIFAIRGGRYKRSRRNVKKRKRTHKIKLKLY